MIINIFLLACLIVVSNCCFVIVSYHGMPCDGSGLPLLAGPHVLWRNLITTVALLSFLMDLADTCQGQDKCQFVVDYLEEHGLFGVCHC